MLPAISRTSAFPPRLAQGLEAASDDELDAGEVLGASYGLHEEVLATPALLPLSLPSNHGIKHLTKVLKM